MGNDSVNLKDLPGFEATPPMDKPYAVNPENETAFRDIVTALEQGYRITARSFDGKMHTLVLEREGKAPRSVGTTQPFPMYLGENGYIVDFREVQEIGLTRELVDILRSKINGSRTRLEPLQILRRTLRNILHEVLPKSRGR